MDFVAVLPAELVVRIFSFFDPDTLGIASMVCKAWRTRTNVDPLWLHHSLIRGWLKYGIDSHHLYQQTAPARPSVSNTSPYYALDVPDDSSLEPICRWKDIFIRARRLRTNWTEGRFTVLPVLRAHRQKISCFDCNGTTLVTGSPDRLLIIWDLQSTNIVFKIDVHSDAINAVKIVGNTIVTAYVDSTIRVFDSSTGLMKMSLQGHHGSVEFLHYNGESIVSVGVDKTVNVWSLAQGKIKHCLRGHTDEIECLKVYKSVAITGSWDCTAKVWDTKMGKEIFTLHGHTEVINCAELSEHKIITGSADFTLRSWSILTGRCSYVFKGHTSEVYCVVFNKEYVASGAADSTVRVWDHQGRQLHSLSEHLGVIRCLYIDDYKLISGGDRRKIIVWNFKELFCVAFKGKELYKLLEHLGVVRCLFMDDYKLVSGGDQKKVVVWDYKNGKKFHVLHRHPTLLHLMWVSDTKLITASPANPGTVTIMNFW